MSAPPAVSGSDTGRSIAELQQLGRWMGPVRRPRRRAGDAIRVLVVADGYRFLGLPFGLDFSHGASGLSRFVNCLLDPAAAAPFEVSLAHLDQRDGVAMMDFEPRVRARLPMFAFDDPTQFHPQAYDVLFLFGCVEKLARDTPEGEIRVAANGQAYPVDRLAETEIAALDAFQRSGGGLFAAGDAGRSGRFLGQHLPRAGQMRRWGDALPAGAGFGEGPVSNVVHLRPMIRSDEVGPSADAAPVVEFPAATDGGPRPVPERVRAGPPGATGISAYDGHRAGIGRTLTAATWRPFLNGALEDIAPRGLAANDEPPGDARCRALALWLSRPGTLDRLKPSK